MFSTFSLNRRSAGKSQLSMLTSTFLFETNTFLDLFIRQRHIYFIFLDKRIKRKEKKEQCISCVREEQPSTPSCLTL